jgi:hypothetical protein
MVIFDDKQGTRSRRIYSMTRSGSRRRASDCKA